MTTAHGNLSISVNDIEKAKSRISNQIIRTPLHHSPGLSSPVGNVYLKLECLQVTGSFKIRGATNAVMALSEAQRRHGVVCVSTGNHGRGLAFAGKQNAIPVIVCMGSLVPKNKIEAIRSLGAEVRIVGDSQDEAQFEADKLAEQGMTMLPPFDHPDIIAGQGTVGLELLDQMDQIDTVVVPLSGGGLLAGVACAIKSERPDTRLIGVTMEKGAAMHESLAAGKPVMVEELPTLADALGGGIGMDNQYTFHMIQQLVDETLLVGEDEIANAIRYAYFQERLVVEGSGAVGMAAILSGKVSKSGNTVILVSGKNIDMQSHLDIASGGS